MNAGGPESGTFPLPLTTPETDLYLPTALPAHTRPWRATRAQYQLLTKMFGSPVSPAELRLWSRGVHVRGPS